MNLYNIAIAAIGRLMWRALLLCVVILFAIIAIYHFTAAGTLALETRFSALHTQLIVGAFYSGIVLITVVILWATGGKRTKPKAPIIKDQRATNIAMLVEALIVGFSLAKKGQRSR